MLRDFGLVTVVDLGVALLGVMLVLPAALVWAEGGFEPVASAARRAGRRAGSRAGRLRPRSDERRRRRGAGSASSQPSRRPARVYSIFVGLAFVA